ncbi:hypothetical protein PAHAL_3G242100 [Panicum hallii]|uniref:Uncharacterized protein n=1 Tax=Panicum hallii TaxID=206008 RepID=A0A2T8KJ71_9POAL|nr:hypothetical protein PAHAL_3G242100 [Panicum hallii]
MAAGLELVVHRSLNLCWTPLAASICAPPHNLRALPTRPHTRPPSRKNARGNESMRKGKGWGAPVPSAAALTRRSLLLI